MKLGQTRHAFRFQCGFNVHELLGLRLLFVMRQHWSRVTPIWEPLMVDDLVPLLLVAFGIVGGIASWGLPARGKAGLALGFIALSGYPLAVVFC